MKIFHMKRWSARALGVATLAWSLSLAACAPSLDWREVRLGEPGGLQALFPCKPERHQRSLAVEGWPSPLTVQMWSCTAAGLTWAVSQTPAADAEAVPTLLAAWPRWTEANLQAAARQLPVARQVEVVALGPVSVPGMTPWPQAQGWRIRTERPDASGRPLPVEVSAWHFAHGLQVYQAAVWRTGTTTEAAKPDELLNPFLNGFQFRP